MGSEVMSPATGPARLLSRMTLASLPRAIARPSYDVDRLLPGIVHLGVSGFHRAHQAVYLDRLAELAPTEGWSVLGAGVRGCSSRQELLAQDCLYTVLERGAQRESARVVGILRDYLDGAATPTALTAALASRSTKLVTLTVTAPAYAEPPRAGDVFDVLARGLDLRRRRRGGPVTVLSCDNLRRNGDEARDRVHAAAAAHSDALVRWVERHVAFPNSLVDRITPPTASSDHRHLRQHYGLHDRAPVVTEPFSQWVVEDRFAAGRPRWEEVGVALTTDVGPYVDHKTRVLNGAHLALGFLSVGTPHRTTTDAMADPVLRSAVERMLFAEVAPGLPHAPGVDPAGYLRQVLARLQQPAVVDPLSRLRRRGSVRMTHYLLPSLRAAVDERRNHDVLLDVVAGWIQHLAGAARQVVAGSHSAAEVADWLADPLAERLLPRAARAAHDVRPLLSAVPGFERLSADATFTGALQHRLDLQESPDRATAS